MMLGLGLAITKPGAFGLGLGVYASAVAANGLPVGNDTTGDGSPQNPYLTLDKAYTAASAGQTIYLNGDPASPTDYRHATFLNIAKALTIDSVRPFGAKISSTTTSARAVNVAGTLGAAVTLRRVTLDGRGLCPSALTVSQQTTLMSLSLLGTRFTGFTSSGVTISASSAVTLTCDGADWSSSADVVQGGVAWLDATTGSSATIRNCTGVISSQTGATYGMVRIRGAVAGLPATLQNNTFSLTVKSGLAASGVHYGILLENMIAAAENNTITVSGGSANHVVTALALTPSPSAPAYSITGSKANSNSLTHTGAAGIILMLGQDVQGSAADGVTSTVEAIGNTCTGSATGQANGLHGILAGGNISATVRRNRVSTTGIGLIDKVGNGCLFAANIVTDSAQSPLRLKGAQNGTYRQNTLIEATAYAGDFVLATNNDIPVVTNTIGANVVGNILYTPALASGGQFVSETSSQGVTYADNDYYAAGAATAPWQVGATTYATLGDWQAAHEADAQAADPSFNGFAPTAPTLLAAVARSALVLSDFYGAGYADPATIGAVQA